MKLHPINHDLKTTLWCGPGALATISGQPTSVCMAALRDSTRREGPVKGVGTCHLVKAAARLGYRLVNISPTADYKPTMAAWTRENKPAFADNPVVLVVANHYVSVKGRSFNDNWCKVPMPLKKARLRRARVAAAYRVEVMDPDTSPPVAKQVKMVPIRPPVNKARAKAMQIARANGFHCGKDNEASDVIWVYAPLSLDTEGLDRYNSEGHACYDWDEALVRVYNYVSDLNTAASAKVATL